jgi:hypothetical protein
VAKLQSSEFAHSIIDCLTEIKESIFIEDHTSAIPLGATTLLDPAPDVDLPDGDNETLNLHMFEERRMVEASHTCF